MQGDSLGSRAGSAASVWFTIATCLALAVGFTWTILDFTDGLEIWVYEERRKVQLSQGRVRAADVSMLGAHTGEADALTDPRPLWQSQRTEADLSVRARARASNVYLVDFIYTRCPTVCRTLGSEFQQMQAAIKQGAQGDGGGRIKLVSVSFDVEHDRPAILKRYADSLAADPAIWSFVVPHTRSQAVALLRSLGVVVVPDAMGGYVHNGSIHLIDGRGVLRGLYEFDQWEQALSHARQIADHLEH